MHKNPLPRLDKHPEVREKLLPHCRLSYGDIWVDPEGWHRVGCLDATCEDDVRALMEGQQASLAIQDPPYNLVAFEERLVSDYVEWCRQWVKNTLQFLLDDSALYIWLGADQNEHFQPLPEFMLMMSEFPVSSRSFITLRNQRGYGTQKNWMAVRQELLYYVKGDPEDLAKHQLDVYMPAEKNATSPAPVFVFFYWLLTCSISNGVPVSRRMMWGESEEAPGAK